MVDDIIKACRNPKIQVVTPIVVFVAVLLLMITSFEYSIAPYFAYPEEEYKFLEEEAEKILVQNNFNSQYVDTIEYEVKNGNLRVKLNANNVNLQMSVSDYGEENQRVEIYKASKASFWFLGIMRLLLHYFIASLILLLFTMIGFELLEYVCVKIQRMRENETNI